MHPPQQRPPAPRVQEECVTQGGWIFKARKAPIIGSLLLEEYSNKLGGVLTLPEILFGNSSLQLKHEASGLTLTFSAFEALQQWKADSLPPLKVALAKEWQAARQQEIEQQQATVLDYDWTYTTSYAGDLSTQPAPNSSSTCDKVNPADQPSKTAAAAAAAAAAAGNVFKPPAAAGVVAAAAAAVGVPGTDAAAADGAVSSTVRLADQGQHQQGTPSSTGSTQQQQQQQQLLPEWQPTERQIDRHMLMSKHEPILFYAEVPLYESELDDNGVCQLTVKVRVMPRCWLVLLRFWLRVDGSLVRLREVRHFCRLDGPQPVVLRETKWSEGTMQELAAAGAPTSVSGYEDADAATAVFSAIAPQCMKKFELHELQLPGSSGAAAGGGAAGGVAAAGIESSS